MSSPDIQVLRAVYDAANRGDWDGFFRDTHPDLELKTANLVTNPGTYRGAAEIRSFFEDLTEPLEQVTVEPEEFIQRGDRIVAFLLVRSRPKGSSATFDIRIAHLWTMRDGKAARCEIFPRREEALDAAGVVREA